MRRYDTQYRTHAMHLRPDLQISRQSYHYLTIMPMLRSTYDGRLIHRTKHLTKDARLFLGTIHWQNRLR